MRRDLFFVGNSFDALKAFPREVRHGIGTALRLAREGSKDPSAKPLRGFGGAGVLEVVQVFDRNTFRAVYTVRLRLGVYVLHCFQKKSVKGIATPAREMNLVRKRLGIAMQRDKETAQ